MDFSGAYTPDHLLFLWDGFLVTLYVALISIVLSFIFGLAAGTLRYAKIPIVSGIIAAIVETIRNLPLLLIIFFTFFCPSGNRDQTGNYRGRHHGADDF